MVSMTCNESCHTPVDTECVNWVGVAITIAVVILLTAVATGPNENAAQASPTSPGALSESQLRERLRPIHRLAVVVGTPTSRVDVDVLWIVFQWCGFHHIGDITVQHSDRCNKHTHEVQLKRQLAAKGCQRARPDNECINWMPDGGALFEHLVLPDGDLWVRPRVTNERVFYAMKCFNDHFKRNAQRVALN